MYINFWLGKKPKSLTAEIVLNYNLSIFAIWPVFILVGAYYNIKGVIEINNWKEGLKLYIVLLIWIIGSIITY